MKYPLEIDGIKQEQNPLKRALIWIWYNDWFRLFFILLPTWILPTIPILIWLRIEITQWLLPSMYIGMFVIACIFNNYSNLRKIGMDEYRNKI